MSSSVKGEITSLIERWRDGDRAAFEELLSRAMQDLRGIARSYLRHERPNPLLETNLLLDDLCLQLGLAKPQWSDSNGFFAFARLLIGHLLITYKRKKDAQRRGGGEQIISLLDSPDVLEPSTLDPEVLLTIHMALDRLAAFDPEGRRLVELKFTYGFTAAEQAEELGWSRATVNRRWEVIRRWLARELQGLSSLEEGNDT